MKKVVLLIILMVLLITLFVGVTLSANNICHAYIAKIYNEEIDVSGKGNFLTFHYNRNGDIVDGAGEVFKKLGTKNGWTKYHSDKAKMFIKVKGDKVIAGYDEKPITAFYNCFIAE